MCFEGGRKDIIQNDFWRKGTGGSKGRLCILPPTDATRNEFKCLVDKKWLRGRFDRILPARSWEMPVKCELPAKIGGVTKKLGGHNFDFRAKSS